MNALRIVLMMLMCLVTDAPAPVTTGVFEYLEDAEEIQAGRRRMATPRPAAARSVPRPATTAAATRVTPALRAQPAARSGAQEPVRKIPAAAREPAAASDDH